MQKQAHVFLQDHPTCMNPTCGCLLENTRSKQRYNREERKGAFSNTFYRSYLEKTLAEVSYQYTYSSFPPRCQWLGSRPVWQTMENHNASALAFNRSPVQCASELNVSDRKRRRKTRESRRILVPVRGLRRKPVMRVNHSLQSTSQNHRVQSARPTPWYMPSMRSLPEPLLTSLRTKSRGALS